MTPVTKRLDSIEVSKRPLGLVKPPDQDQAPNREIPRIRSVEAVSVRFQRSARRVERLRRPAQITRGQCGFSLGDDASRAGHHLLRTEGTRGTAEQGLGPNQIAKLRHGNAAESESGRVVAESDPLQCSERIARRERAGRGRDQ